MQQLLNMFAALRRRDLRFVQKNTFPRTLHVELSGLLLNFNVLQLMQILRLIRILQNVVLISIT